MISFILSLVPLFLIFYYFFMLKNKISDYSHFLVLKKSGRCCYKCNQKNKFEEIQYRLYLCKSCDREMSVDSIISPMLFLKNRFLKFIFSNRFEKLQTILLYLTIVFLFLNLILSFFEYDINSIPSSLLLCLYWILMIYRTKLVINGF
jgi:hypothetical protein